VARIRQLLGQVAPPWEPDALDSGVPAFEVDVYLRGRIGRASRYTRFAIPSAAIGIRCRHREIRDQETMPDGRLRLTLDVRASPQVDPPCV
jgi:hypothetical protein